MGRVQEGAFDPGPPPPELPKVDELVPDAPQEDFRQKCLRRLKEQEEREARALDWYGQLAGNCDPGDEAQQWRQTGQVVRLVAGTPVSIDLAAPGSDQTAVAIVRPPRLLRDAELVRVHGADALDLRLEFGTGSRALMVVQRLRGGHTPAETAKALREMADRIEFDLCSPMDRILARAERFRW